MYLPVLEPTMPPFGSSQLDAAQQVARVDGSVESVVNTNPLSVHPT
jgi:hypothetical protein